MTRRAKDVASSAASVMGVVASTVWRPFVHPWMLVDSAKVRHCATQLDDHLPKLRAVLEEAAADAQAACTVCEAVEQVRDAMAKMADALDVHGTQLRHLLRTRPHDLARIRLCTDALSEADARCRASVVSATRMLPSLRELVAGTPWAPTDSTIVTSTRVGVSVTADEGEVPSWLAPALAQAEPGECSLHRVARVRHACASATEDDLAQAVRSVPEVMGSTDGVPLTWRMRANRHVMREALRRLRAEDMADEFAVVEQHRRDASSLWRSAEGAVLDAWLANDAITAMASVQVDRATARRAQRRHLITLTQQLLHDRVDQGRGRWGRRQVLQYDTAGHVVELWGAIDGQTAQVAVYVGGTGTTVRQFGWPTGIARALHRADPSGRTAVVTWMGSEFPSAIGTQSPFGRFARKAAVPLRDCVEGLGVPDDVSITVIGHSYGGTIVGAAEAVGLRVNRVVHAGVPGIGPGVRSVADYPECDALGRPRRVQRFALTAPGDLIRVWRRGDAAVASVLRMKLSPVRAAAAWVDEKILGADPMTLPGIVELDTGLWERDRDDRRAGEILFGPRGHADVVEPGTTSFRRIVAIVQGQDPRDICPPPQIVPFRWRPGKTECQE